MGPLGQHAQDFERFVEGSVIPIQPHLFALFPAEQAHPRVLLGVARDEGELRSFRRLLDVEFAVGKKTCHAVIDQQHGLTAVGEGGIAFPLTVHLQAQALILGDETRERGVVTLKHLATGEQTEIDRQRLLDDPHRVIGGNEAGGPLGSQEPRQR